jgi:F-type H+-transporting ATPase subunit b
MWLIFISSFAVLHFFVIKPTLEIISARQHKTKGLMAESELLEKDAARLLIEYEAKMNSARNEARRIRENILSEIHATQADMLLKARQEANSALDGVRQQIAQEVKTAQKELEQSVQELAQEITQKLFERKVA